MNIDLILQKFERFGVHLGLESIQRLLANLGNPHQRVPVIHVAGSNGKGSVCAYLSAVLTAAGYRTGRYTSPHLVDWCERICINDQPIAPADLETVLQQVIASIQPDEPSPTQFEVITAAAWLHFAQQQVDIAVIEVGLGGRLDATNVCDRPLASIITSLSCEHWQRLGPTLADIAREKAGILKPNCPAIIGQLPPEAKAVVDRRIAELNCPVIYPQPATFLEKGKGERGKGNRPLHLLPDSAGEANTPHSSPLTPHLWATYQGIPYPLPLQGEIQLHNSALAIAALQVLRQRGWQISDQAIAQGMAKTQWAGRLQWFTWQGQQILIDGAHNPASAEVLRQFVDSLGEDAGRGRGGEGERGRGGDTGTWGHGDVGKLSEKTSVCWVMGMLSTKDHAEVFEALLREGDRLYLVPVPDHSSADLEALAELAQTICPTLAACKTFPDVFTALTTAISEMPQESNPLTVLCGSLYLIGHFFKTINLLQISEKS